MQTDAKIANFCFSENETDVAAVDFQYVGGGCGMKDLAYFMSSCFGPNDCQRYEAEALDLYFSAFNKELQRLGNCINPMSVEQEWRPLYLVAWADFYRFLNGWCPDHWKVHRYSRDAFEKTYIQLFDHPC